MNLKKSLARLAVAVAVAASMPASAVVLTSESLATGNTVTDFSADGLVSFDLALTRPTLPSALTFEIEAADLTFGGLLTFNAIVGNSSGFNINHFKLFIDGATFAVLGTADGFGAAVVSGGPSAAVINLLPPNPLDIVIGDPFGGTPGYVDWQISIAGLELGDTFTLTMQAPAPATIPLFLAGLGLAGFLRRRRNGAER